MINYATINGEDFEALKHILFAGEVFPPKYLKQLMETLPHASYYNLYGPTETNVCTFHHVKNKEDSTDRPAPIGIACANTEVIALNENDMPVSTGEEGELMVKGSTVTKGYYKDPEKTKEAFRTSPLAYHNGALLYKTGDIVRRCDDGSYDYVGRKDLMVKCSGYRVELQEIEYALYQYESIEEAVVVPMFNEKRGTTDLYALVKLHDGFDFSILKIKKYLGELLPRYMIPENIERVEDIPKTATGKIDRKRAMQLVKVLMS
jgi:acyl-coenzyme A synthetase/AMP-(fatty) acid ligase